MLESKFWVILWQMWGRSIRVATEPVHLWSVPWPISGGPAACWGERCAESGAEAWVCLKGGKRVCGGA